MASDTVRLSYIDVELARRVAADVAASASQTRRRLTDEPNKLVQRRRALLASDMAMLAAYRYALGEPISRSAEDLRDAAEQELEVFELRGTQPAFPATVVTLDINSSSDAPEVISREPRNPPGSKDYSLTNSRSGLKAIYMALASGHVLVAHRLAQLIWDPPHADYVGEKSEVCTPADHHLAYAVKHFILGDEEAALEELTAVESHRSDIALQVSIFGALLNRDVKQFLESLRLLLKWHEKEAKKKSNRTATDLYLALPAIGLSILALRAGLIRADQLPTDNPHFPVEMIEIASVAASSRL